MRPLSPGGKAWIGLSCYVIGADIYLIATRNKTMSSVFGDALNHPIRRWPVLVTWGFLTLHLNKAVLPGAVGCADPLAIGFLVGEKVWYSITNGKSEIPSYGDSARVDSFWEADQTSRSDSTFDAV